MDFIGNVTEEDGIVSFSNTIASKIVIKNGARVKFSNIYFKIDRSDHNFYISEHSSVVLSCVGIENVFESNEYYIFNLEEESTLYADQLWVNATLNQPIIFSTAVVTIKNSKLNVEILAVSNTTLELENVSMKVSGRNAINLKDSNATLRSYAISGEDFPTIYSEKSKLTLENGTLKALGANAINLKNTEMVVKDCMITGEAFPVIYTEKSKSELENTTVKALGANAINLKDSNITVKNCRISGGDNEKKFPATYVESSNLYSYNTIFE